MNKDISIILMSSDIKDTDHSILRFLNIKDTDHSILRFLNIEDIITKPIKLKDLIEKINIVKQKIIVKRS